MIRRHLGRCLETLGRRLEITGDEVRSSLTLTKDSIGRLREKTQAGATVSTANRLEFSRSGKQERNNCCGPSIKGQSNPGVVLYLGEQRIYEGIEGRGERRNGLLWTGPQRHSLDLYWRN